MTKINPLNYEELIIPNRGVSGIISPRDIPIHPKVRDSDFAYTSDFIISVCGSMEKSLINDISTIERIFDVNLDMEICPDYLSQGSIKLLFERIKHIPNSKNKSIDVVYGSSNIALDNREGYKVETKLHYSHPMSKSKLEEYSIFSDKNDFLIPVWYTHNPFGFGFPLELYFRNFAIMFNNLGIKNLEN